MNTAQTTVSTIPEHPQGSAWHSQSAEDVLAELASTAAGLSTQEAAQRLVAEQAAEKGVKKAKVSARRFVAEAKDTAEKRIRAASSNR